jgi:NAD(P)H-hydrate epimerase
LGASDCPLPCALDADALTILAREDNWRSLLNREVVITPHPGEAARLLGVDNAAVQKDRLAAVKALAEGWPGVAVLKGAGVLIFDRTEATKLVAGGNPGMATAGSGDVLTGIVGAFMARGIPGEGAAPAACAIHAGAGDLAAEDIGREGMTAGDILNRVARVIQTLEVRA